MICCLNTDHGTRPFLSICIPTWNRSAKLAAQLERLAPHVTDAIAITIVDNGSTDDTIDNVLRFSERHPSLRLSLWSNEINLGADVNYLRVLELATGIWLWLLGDDDLIDPARLGLLVTRLQACQHLALLYLNEWGMTNVRPPMTFDLKSFLNPAVDRLGHAIHKIGLFVIRREAALPGFARAYREGVGLLHAYSFLTLGALSAGVRADLIEVPGLIAPQTDLPANPPRWNHMAGLLGAWRTSERALPLHRRQVRRRESRLRTQDVLASFVHQLADARGASRQQALWIVRTASTRRKPLAVALFGLAMLPRPVSRQIVAGLLMLRRKQPMAQTGSDEY